MLFRRHPEMVDADRALPGRAERMPVPDAHLALGTPLVPPWPDGHRTALVAMGCFWGAERVFWSLPGVWTTAVGYAGGVTPNPTYEEACSGLTGHAEAVLVVFDPAVLPFEQLVSTFWEAHDPTQGMRQGNDVGTQYRSALWWDGDDQRGVVERSAEVYGERLAAAGHGPVTTELGEAPEFFYAEPYHQQYLVAHPNGYCGLGSTGVSCPVGVIGAD
jgi:peptide-methionine (S)-S-oxide reductase